MGRAILIALLLVGLSGCALTRNAAGSLGLGKSAANRTVVEADGVEYRARVNTDAEDKRDMSITVTPAAGNPEAAVSAGVYQATRYCILTYGGSDKEWTVGPDTPIESLPITDDTLTLQGRCTQR